MTPVIRKAIVLFSFSKYVPLLDLRSLKDFLRCCGALQGPWILPWALVLELRDTNTNLYCMFVKKTCFIYEKFGSSAPFGFPPLPDPLNIMMRVYNRNITFIHKTHFFCAVSAKHELYAPKLNRPCNVVMGWWAGYGGEVWFWTSVSLSYFFLQACTCVSFSEVECGLEKLRQISITFRSRPD